MALQVTIPAQFVLSPPLDLPLRINSENGCFSCARLHTFPFDHDCCSDHFASLHPEGDQGVQRIHEAVDLASTEGACVYAAGSGVATTVQDTSLTITHPGIQEGFATRYVHVTPLVVKDEAVATGQPIATVNASDHGDHLHFGLWHWIDLDDQPPSPKTTIPIDPARLLYHWERFYELDWATVAVLNELVVPALDAAIADPQLLAEFNAAALAIPTNPVIEPLAPGCVWRITGDDITYLLRRERNAVTVFDERYGTQTVRLDEIERVGLTIRRKMPVFLAEAGGQTYGIPLHDVANDQLHGAGGQESMMADLLRQAYQQRTAVDLEVRRSPFWGMDGSLDEYLAVIDGVRLG